MVITIDPGVFTMGGCLWESESGLPDKPWGFPLDAMAFDLSKQNRHPDEATQTMILLVQELNKWFTKGVACCYCEKLQIFTSAKGMASAIKGHVLQVEMFRGILASKCSEYNVPFVDVPVLHWKGQLSKDLTIKRIRKIFDKHIPKCMSKEFSHDWDAAGIGFYLQDMF